MTRIPQELEAAALHVGYEALAMVEMTMRLNSHTGNGVVGNALEATLLHCRNMIDFLGPWAHRKDDIVPGDFVTGWNPTLLKVTDDERTAIHKHLAHLTWARVGDGQQQWEFPGIVGATFAAWSQFVELAEKELCPVAPVFRGHNQAALIEMGAITSPAETSIHYTTGSDRRPVGAVGLPGSPRGLITRDFYADNGNGSSAGAVSGASTRAGTAATC